MIRLGLSAAFLLFAILVSIGCDIPFLLVIR